MNSPIIIDEMYAEAEVYADKVTKHNTHLYLVKVSFTDIGMYISGITVQPSPRNPEHDLWVQPPRYQPRQNSRWVKPIEFDYHSALWRLIEEMARKAVNDHSPANDGIYMPTDKELDNVDEIVGRQSDKFLEGLEEPP